jgi:hypothetical protein
VYLLRSYENALNFRYARLVKLDARSRDDVSVQSLRPSLMVSMQIRDPKGILGRGGSILHHSTTSVSNWCSISQRRYGSGLLLHLAEETTMAPSVTLHHGAIASSPTGSSFPRQVTSGVIVRHRRGGGEVAPGLDGTCP